MTTEPVSAHDLTPIFRVDVQTLRYWGRQGFLTALTPPTPGLVPTYSPHALNEFLAGRQVHFAIAPTIQQLLCGEIVLLSRDETALLTGLVAGRLSAHVTRGNFAAIRLPGDLLYEKKSVLHYAAANSDPSLVTFDQAGHVLGVDTTRVRLLVPERLACVTFSPRKRRIVRASLVHLADELLPGWLDAEQWIANRLASERVTFTITMAMRQLNLGRIKMEGLLRDQHIAYITTAAPHGKPQFRLSPESVLAYQMVLRKLTATDVMHLFGVKWATAAYWIETRALCKSTHRWDSRHCPRYECVHSYVASHTTHSTLDAGHWLTQRRRDGMAILSEAEVTDMLVGGNAAAVTAALQSGSVRGVWLPPAARSATPELRILAAEARAFQRIPRTQLAQRLHD